VNSVLKKNMNKIQQYIIAGALGLGTVLPARAQATFTQTEVATPTQIISRSEIVASDGDFDLYATVELAEKNLANIRLQWIPLDAGIVSFGIIGRYFGSEGTRSRAAWGGVVRVKDRVAGGIAKGDIRYFPDIETFTTYGFWKSGSIFVNVLGSYNVDNGRYMARPGFDVNLGELSLGIEAKISGKEGHAHVDYIGPRVMGSW